jgi:hypothetical protein
MGRERQDLKTQDAREEEEKRLKRQGAKVAKGGAE